ncbi:glycosyltransferase family 4 protein [uncultured Caulobacter sp.]|uniref:glycosyltransferase family 4 protein n=1 Tax=uncultured Caulobacter sp. TaxID=158749 RepID=UPI002611F78D|nr:glycosyltransferase family 4 protein [uncultured Caulobacter sp.]
MKVCFQTKAWGEGAGWFAQELALGIAEAGAEVVFVAPPAVPADREPVHPNLQRIFIHRELQAGGKLKRIASSLRRVFDGARQALIWRRKVDVHLFSIPDPLIFFLPLQILLRLLGARHVVVVHDARPHAWAKKGWADGLHYLAIKLSYSLANSLVATTSTNKADLIETFGIDPADIDVLPHGVFDLGEQTSAPGNGKLLVFGALRRNKRILETIKAFQICRAKGMPIRLVIAGGPDRADKEYWADCIKQIEHAPESIDMEIGFVSDARVSELIADCDVALLPYERFSSASGVAILLATSQRPLIATATGGIGDLFELGLSGIPLSEQADVDDIVAAIEVFFSKPVDIWRQEASRARERLLKELSWKEIGIGYLKVLGDRYSHPG